jgi:hypothetical protein
MKKTLLICATVAMAFGVLNANAKIPYVTANSSKTAYAIIGMSGPSTVSLAGYGYTYTVKLWGQTLADDTRWIIVKDGSPVTSFYANGNSTTNLSGGDFGSTGIFVVFLIGTVNEMPTIYGSQTVTVTP